MFPSNKDLKLLEDTVNQELFKLSTWFKANKLSLNLKKTKYIIFTARNKHCSKDNININIDNNIIDSVNSTTFLGVQIKNHLHWKPHVNNIALKMDKSIGVINKIKSFLSVTTRQTL